MADSDSDDAQWEDVPIQHQGETGHASDHANGVVITPAPWTPLLTLPPQRATPIPAGSDEENNMRNRIDLGIENVNYRQMKAEIGMFDDEDVPASQRPYESFMQLAGDVEKLVDLLWGNPPNRIPNNPSGHNRTRHKATPTGPTNNTHTATQIRRDLPRPLHRDRPRRRTSARTGTIRPPARHTDAEGSDSESRGGDACAVFSAMPDDEDEEEEDAWAMEATKIYEGVLMLLAG
ncbi:hypothetical protein N7532_002399 [Penicillium argentinense]|uniref:Uncharacterized protein n=1 Tax=Penicillium argentinense TaxID=1131581 RepID=A0A9W9KK85_9EURO|nr:uncharacterized protein N7532_002399 [Penicillium argentinense]KAJ5109754.1 hypothetical protein N7532_002399 [Penicillium argentinense]